MRRGIAQGVGLAVLLVGLTGCGYTAGGPYRSGISTVHVEMFNARTYRRDLEFQLTEAVKKRIGSDTPYRLSEKADADTVLRGEVLRVDQVAWAPDPASRLPREKQIAMSVRVQWQDLRNGRLLIDQPIELTAADYAPPLGESEAYALQQVSDKMAEKIISGMYDPDW